MKTLSLIVAILISTSAFCTSDKVIKTEKYTSGEVKVVYTELENGTIEVISYWENGVVKEQGQYVNEKLSGTWTTFNQDATKTAEVTFNHGKRVGVAYAWNNSGELVGTIDYSTDGYAQLIEE